MELATVEENVRALDLPAWVLDRRVIESLDHRGEPLVRVRLKVDEDFDVEGHADEYFALHERIREVVWQSGVPRQTWVIVGLTDDAPTDQG